MYVWVYSESADTSASADTTSPAEIEEVWNTVKFSFEIEEVSASVFWKETAKVCMYVCKSLFKHGKSSVKLKLKTKTNYYCFT